MTDEQKQKAIIGIENNINSLREQIKKMETDIANLEDILSELKGDNKQSLSGEENLCESCTNVACGFQSGIKRSSCAFYMPPRLESDNCGNYISELKGE